MSDKISLCTCHSAHPHPLFTPTIPCLLHNQGQSAAEGTAADGEAVENPRECDDACLGAAHDHCGARRDTQIGLGVGSNDEVEKYERCHEGELLCDTKHFGFFLLKLNV